MSCTEMLQPSMFIISGIACVIYYINIMPRKIKGAVSRNLSKFGPQGDVTGDDFSATQRCIIAATLFRMVATLFQYCNAVLCYKSWLRIVPCYITFRNCH